MPLLPTRETLEAFRAEDDGRPVTMLNLLRYSDDGSLYGEYSRQMLPILARFGAEVVYSGECSTRVIAGEDYGRWDAVVLVRYPSRSAFLEMVADPEYLRTAKLREEGLADSVLQATDERYPRGAAA
ncbi:MAG: DUF1330 domain-containing protein [Solirubrobacterales bacterium]